MLTAFFSLILTFSESALGEMFSFPNGTLKIEAYGVWVHECRIGSETISYTVYDNQTASEFSNACALTYSYSKCETKVLDSGVCPGAKWNEITKKKLLFISASNKKSCFHKAKVMTQKLSSKGFSCTESGIN